MTATKKAPRAYNGSGSAIDNYNSDTPVFRTETEQDFSAFDYKNPQHKFILSMLHTMGWTKTLPNGKVVGNMETFGHWLKTKSPIALPLTKMNPAQTSKVIFAFEKVVKHQFS